MTNWPHRDWLSASTPRRRPAMAIGCWTAGIILLASAAGSAQTNETRPAGKTGQSVAQSPAAQPPAAAGQRRPAAVVSLDVPLLLGQVTIGDVAVIITRQEELVSFGAESFFGLTGGFLKPEIIAGLRRQVKPTGQLQIESIQATGIGVTYDKARVEVRLDVPLDLQTVRLVSLSQGYVTDLSQITGPSAASGYVNFLAARDNVSPDQGKEPLILDLDGAVNLFGNVVEGAGTYRSEDFPRWQRSDVRFVHDDAESRIRYSAGDLRYGLDGFQTTQRAAGFAIARNFGLQPYRSSVPSGMSQLDLNRNSRVDVIVNGQRIRTMDLAPGRYNVRDFPFVSGTNDVTLRITDEVGRVEVVNFPFVYDTTVLAAGEQDFAYAFGVPAEVTATGRQYDSGDRVMSAYHAYGVTDQLTLGANYQGSRDLNVVGGEGRLATNIGTFRLDTAASRLQLGSADQQQTASGAAVRLQHRFTEQPAIDGDNRNLASSVTFRTPSFASLGQTTPNNPTFLDTQFLYGQRLDRDLYASLGVGREFSRGSQADVTTADLNFSLPLGREVTAYLLLGTRRSSEGEIENRMFLSISWFPFGSGHRFGSSYDTSMRSRRLDWSYTSPTRVNAVDADLSVNRTADDDLLDGSVTYTGYRFTSRAAQTTTTGRQEGDGHSQRTALNFGTALAFAGGHVAVSRPIADSFVLFPQHPVLSSQDIEVNPVDDKPAARSDLLGMAVLPDMTSYYQHHVVLDAPDLPLGYELGRQIYDVQPTYRSGIVIPVGTGATVLGDGVLVDPGGRPLPLEPGQILSLDTPGQPAIDFFTSRSGRFRVEGLAPGRYRLTLLNTPERAIEFTIPPGSAGRFDLGRLTYDIEP